MEKKVTAMLLRPGKEAELISIEPSFGKIEELVGGIADFTWPINDRLCVVVNDTGKLDGLPLNRALRNSEGKIVDIYAGDIVILGCHKREGFDDLTPDETKELMERFGRPEFGWKVEDFIDCSRMIPEAGDMQVVAGKVGSFEELMSVLKEVFQG